MKIYVITVSEKFPKTHKRAGEQTNFVEKIDSINCDLPFPPFDPKIHTIRANYELWKKRFEQIENGKALLSVRVWEGKPYNSKQREVFKFDKTNGIGIQKLELDDYLYSCLIDGKRNSFNDIPKNDGLSHDDFENWFVGYDFTKPMAIIHFTDFRYCG